MKTINLGDEVEDTITGFRGIAIGRHTFLHGLTSITVQPVLEHYGILPDSEVFAEAALKTTKANKTKAPVTAKGIGLEFIGISKETI